VPLPPSTDTDQSISLEQKDGEYSNIMLTLKIDDYIMLYIVISEIALR